jgi:DNA-binding transcriptional LysR family regulator
MNAPLDTALLNTFVAVADARSFTGAGRRLSLSQSAVSAQIFRLEEQIGCPLLIRSTRSVSLTEHGQTLVGYARAMLTLSQEAKNRLGTESGFSGKLRIGASEDFASGWLPNAMRQFGSARHGLLIDLRVDIGDNLFQRYANGEFDLVIGSRCAHFERTVPLWKEPLAWGFSLFERLPDGVVPLACFPDPCPFREAAIKALTLAAIPYRIACESPSVTGILALARAGIAIAPLPRSMIVSGLREIGPSDGFPALPDIKFEMMHDTGMPAAVAFSERILDEIAVRVNPNARVQEYQ